jgi:hypothetical protein
MTSVPDRFSYGRVPTFNSESGCGVNGSELPQREQRKAKAPNPSAAEPGIGVWAVVKSWFGQSDSKPESSTGYYVRSTAHPVVGGPDMTLDEVFDALQLVDETYKERPRR